MNEWEFTTDVISWINEILSKDKTLPFSRAYSEQRAAGSEKRRDITLHDHNQVVILTGEVKLPYQKDGGSPYNEKVVQDARKKAEKAKAKFFFTWNVNEFVLWETFSVKTIQIDRKYRNWNVTSPFVHKPGHLENPSTKHSIQIWLSLFLNEFAGILKGTSTIGTLLPDEKFIVSLESSLRMPILMTIEELGNRYEKPKFKDTVDRWMREEQGWIIYDNPEGIRDNLERASKFACYALVNKLVFHEALLKRYGARMNKITVPEHLDTAEGLRLHLEKFFLEAKKTTRDYETVFGEDHTAIGNRIPFFADSAVPHWRELIEQIHEFNFSKIDYEIIGSIFERLISPEERHKYGQFYTRPEVVDLINSFCIRNGEEKVMDPACGGGTFLVRAYARKRELAPDRKHGDLLTDLFGVDISHFATHLTTINLATRDLIDDENYPQIARNDFFEIKEHRTFITLPTKIKTHGLGTLQHKEIEIPPLDAIIGNPPYIRQEDIAKSSKKNAKGEPQHSTKDYYQYLVKKESGLELSGRSDLHCYFWPHAAMFLKEGGYLCLLTSSQWLDVEYGFKLQSWILKNFDIVGIFESIDEPWFEGARVATTVTILKRNKDDASRFNNIVRFVQLRRPITEILSHDGTTVGAIEAANMFRDEVLSLTANTITESYRSRLIKQEDLWKNGVQLGEIMRGTVEDSGEDDEELEDETEVIGDGDYYGGKWGVYLRASNLWFDLLDRYEDHFIPLGKIADVRFGVKSGKDSFFFPKDISDECLQEYEDSKEFLAQYGVQRKDVESGSISLVQCGDKLSEVKPIETKYLEPEVHSLMEVDSFSVSSGDCARKILLFTGHKGEGHDKYVRDYIKWGEKKNYHTGKTCKGRVSKERAWYDLTSFERPDIILPKIQQYRLLSFLNPERLYANSSLLGIFNVQEELVLPLCGVLNSTVAILSRLIYARILGNEGNIQLDVYSAKMMLVPNLNATTPKDIVLRIANAFKKVLKRKALQFIPERRMREMAYRNKGKEKELDDLSDMSEIDMPDRRELDDAVLELIGIRSKKQRDKMIDDLYTYLKEYFEMIRLKEEKALVNKKTSKRREKVSPLELAQQIFKEIEDNAGYLLKSYQSDFLDIEKPFDTCDIPIEGDPHPIRGDLYMPYGVVFRKGKRDLKYIETKNESQDELIVTLAMSGVRGLTRIPLDSAESQRVHDRYKDFVSDRDKRLRELIENRTADEDMQEKIFDVLMHMILQRH